MRIALLALSAFAWEPEPARLIAAVPAPADVVVASIEGSPRLVATGPEGSSLVDPASGLVLAELGEPGRDLLLVDLNGDQQPELLRCSEAGIYRLSWDLSEAWQLSASACTALVARRAAGALELVVAQQDVRAYPVLSSTELGEGRHLLRRPSGRLWLASHADAVAVAGSEEPQVLQLGPRGVSVYATGLPIGGLVRGPLTWAWTLPGTATLEDVTGRVVALNRAPGGLDAADLDGDGRIDLAVAHPGSRHLGVILGAAEERLLELPVLADEVRVVELSGDGCADLLAWSVEQPGIGVVPGRCDDGELRGSGVRIEGDARTVWLRSAAGSYPEGELPAGTYEVQAWFGQPGGVPAGVVRVPESRPITLRCNEAMMRCVRVDPGD